VAIYDSYRFQKSQKVDPLDSKAYSAIHLKFTATEVQNIFQNFEKNPS